MPIRVVVDSNCLSSPHLEDFLRCDPQNYAIITDYIWMEAYKAKSIPVLKKSLSVIGRFPDQTIFLRGTRYVSGLDYRSPGVAGRMEWKGVRQDFKETVRKLETLDERRYASSFQTNDLVLAATAHIDGKMLESVRGFTKVFEDIARIFSTDEVARIRSGMPVTHSIAYKIFKTAGDLSSGIARRRPDNVRGLSRRSQVNSFMLRYALSNVLLIVDWIRRGSPATIREDKLRNDQVDIILGVYGSYFNGVLSEDRKMKERSSELRVVLKILGGRVLLDWSDLIAAGTTS